MPLADDLTDALRSAPELRNTPGIALAAAQSGDATGNAQALAHATNQAATQGAIDQVAQKHGGHSFLGATLGWVSAPWREARHVLGVAGGGALKVMGAGLTEVQHQWRYVHDIAARHGTLAGVLEAGLFAAGAVGGALLAPEIGLAVAGTAAAGVIGGELGVGALARLNPLYKDSWAKTADGEAYRDPHSGQQVSPGRDIARLLGLKETKGLDPFSVVSAVTDGIFDLTADPFVQVTGGLSKAAKARIAISKVEDVDRAYNASARVQRAFEDLSKLKPGEIPLRYPRFKDLAEELGKAGTVDEVKQVFREKLAAHELSQDIAPTRSVLGALAAAGKVKAQELQGPIQWAKVTLGKTAPETEGFTARLVRKLGNNIPTWVDPETSEQVRHAFDVNAPGAVAVVHETMRATGASNALAEDVATRFASTASIAGRIRLYKNMAVETLLSQLPDDARAAAEDSEFIKSLRHQFDETQPAGVEAGRAEQYGHDIEGRNLSRVMDDDGGEFSAGILASHKGLTAIPDYDKIREVVASRSNLAKIVNGADDFFYSHFTGGIFKPLALAQPSTGMRIGAAEAIQGLARHGLMPYVREQVQRAVNAFRGPMAEHLGDQEAGFLHETMAQVAGGIEKLAGLSPEEASDLAKYVDFHGGTRTPMALRAGHAHSEDLLGKQAHTSDVLHSALQDVPRGMRVGHDFGEFGQTDARHVWHWQAWLREISGDEASRKAAKAYLQASRAGASAEEAEQAGAAAAKAHWDAQPEEVLESMHRHRWTSVPGADPHTEWGQVIMENIKGATHTPEGEANLTLLRAVRDGKITSRQALERIDTLDRPAMVKGRLLVPDTTTSVQRIADWGFRRLVDPIVNTMARDPLYRLEWKAQFEPFKAAINAGEMEEHEAMQWASKRAIVKMRRYIHNPMERSLFSAQMQNVIPFFFAQEQAYRRAGRLLLDDPAAFRKVQLASTALHDVAFPVGGADGNPNGAVALPGGGFLGRYVPAIANVLGLNTLGTSSVGFAGSLHSLQTVSPLAEEPGVNFGPLVVFAAKSGAYLTHGVFPETTAIVDKLIGPEASAGSAWDSLIPNITLRRVYEAQRMDSRKNQSTMMQIVQMESFRQEEATRKWEEGGSVGPEPHLIPGPDSSAMERQVFLDRVKNHTRVLDYLKAAVGFVSPMSPQFTIGQVGLTNEFHKMIDQTGSVGKAATQFLLDHPDATPYTVAQSEAADRSPIQATHPAQQFIDAHRDLIDKYPAAAFYLVPQGGKYDGAIYNEQLAMGARHKRTPDEFLRQVYIAQGNHDYQGSRAIYLQALGDARGDKAKTDQLKHRWSAYVQAQGVGNPVWLDDLQSPERQNAKKLALTQLQSMFAKGDAPAGAQTDAVQGLLADFGRYQAASMPGRRDDVAIGHRKVLDVRWEKYLDQVIQEQPEMAPIVNRLFREMSEADRVMAGLGERVTA